MRHYAFLAAGSTHRLYLPSLDGARGLAIILVLLDHMASAKIIPFPSLRGVGHIGVYLFFSLSAFLLTAPFCLKSAAVLQRWQTWSVYFERRILRIFPLYVIVLIVEHYIHAGYSWGSVRDHLLLRKGEGIFWTMEIETKYYLVLPLMILTFMVAWRKGLWAGVIGTAALVGVLLLLFRVEAKWWSLDGHVLWTYFWIFFFGSVAGTLFALKLFPATRHPTLQWALEGAAWFSLILAFFSLPTISQMLPAAWTPSGKSDTNLSGLLMALFLLTHLHGSGFLKNLLEWRPLRYLGVISYSLYLWHKPVISCFGDLKQADRFTWVNYSWPVHTTVVLLATLSVATLSFFLVERPISRLKAGFTRSL